MQLTAKKYTSNGYLKEDFRLFHITTPLSHDIDYHYHNFHKVFIFLKGKGEYHIEEKRYDLRPGDVVLIPAGALHRPVIQPGEEYERIIIYISDEFFNSSELKNLFGCFAAARNGKSHLVHPDSLTNSPILGLYNQLIDDVKDSDALGAALLRRLHVTEFLVHINRSLSEKEAVTPGAFTTNQTVRLITDYISKHFSESITIDDLANALFLNRSYIMHLFKKETGTTIGRFITEKRLFEATKLIKEGHPVGEASVMCGFSGYSAFHYAYSKMNSKDRSGSE